MTVYYSRGPQVFREQLSSQYASTKKDEKCANEPLAMHQSPLK